MKEEIICHYCMGPMQPKRSTKKYCSEKCRVYGNRESRMVREHIVREGVELKILPPRAEKTYEFCKHDAVKGFCKKGCK